jgi:Fur family transcriptional regulator, ferric uptake regulator
LAEINAEILTTTQAEREYYQYQSRDLYHAVSLNGYPGPNQAEKRIIAYLFRTSYANMSPLYTIGTIVDKQELRRAGLKITLPRVKILSILENSTLHHLSAEDVYRLLVKAGDDVGLATVYRVLTQFEAAGLVIRHNFEGNTSVYEVNHGEHHDHLVCVKCGAIEEFLDDVIEARQLDIARQAGFKMTDHALNIYGLCRQCQVMS